MNCYELFISTGCNFVDNLLDLSWNLTLLNINLIKIKIMWHEMIMWNEMMKWK